VDFPFQTKTWAFGPWLVGATADYYLLADAHLAAIDAGHNNAEALEAEWRSHAGGMAREIARYLVLACGGELRHNAKARRDAGWSKATTIPRNLSWERVKVALEGTDDAWVSRVMAGWAERFAAPGEYDSSVGGKPWAQACSLTAQYLSGEISCVLFIEYTLNLHHNCAIIFNKRPLPSQYASILAAGAAGLDEPSRWALMCQHGSPERMKLWLTVRGLQESDVKAVAPRSPKPSVSLPKMPKVPKTGVPVGNKLW